jgi:N-carbamoylputrescine amidase
MPRTITTAAIQTSYGEDMAANIAKTEGFIRAAAAEGAQVILPSELFQGPYFCVTQEER